MKAQETELHKKEPHRREYPGSGHQKKFFLSLFPDRLRPKKQHPQPNNGHHQTAEKHHSIQCKKAVCSRQNIMHQRGSAKMMNQKGILIQAERQTSNQPTSIPPPKPLHDKRIIALLSEGVRIINTPNKARLHGERQPHGRPRQDRSSRHRKRWTTSRERLASAPG